MDLMYVVVLLVVLVLTAIWLVGDSETHDD